MFHLFFQKHVASVFVLDVAYISRICCKCFYLDVAYVCNDFSSVFKCFASVLDMCCKCFSCFKHMLQVFHLDVVEVDLVLHMFQLF
jgi:hypothetical protein